MNQIDILSELNESQRSAVEYCSSPQMIIAGAGAGKTRVLTYKVAYLLQIGMKPWTVLTLTFTNKAADEMKVRISRIVGNETANQLTMGTFHSVFSRILRVEAEILGFHSNFTIYDEADSRSLLKSIVKELGEDEKTYKPSTVHAAISMAKNHLKNAESFALREPDSKMPKLASIFKLYEQRCAQANAMDFDDLLVLTYRLFKEHPDICSKYAHRYQYILVDEYQDTNYAQQSIVELLTRENQKVCVVGDDAQSIYGFRGANIDNILQFHQIYPEARLFKLEQNYRSTQRIVQAANSLIKHNEHQIPKDVYSENDTGERLLLKSLYSDKEEATVVCKDIMRIRRQESCPYSNFAILYRTNAQSRNFEEELLKYNIPYRIYGGLSFYQRKEIKDIIAYFRLIVNPDDEEAFKRIVNYPARGIGDVTIQKIAAAAQKGDVSFWEVINQPMVYGLAAGKAVLTKLASFAKLIESFREALATEDAFELGRRVIQESGISADIYSETDATGLSRQENLQEFLNSLEDFVEGNREQGGEEQVYLPDFLQIVSLYQDKETASESKVSLMTVHAAKGLEFDTVFIVGMEENIFPSRMSVDSSQALEEERRLLYVAITRAERRCVLTCVKNRWRYGKQEFCTPSRFLADIDSKYLSIEDNVGNISVQPRNRQPERIALSKVRPVSRFVEVGRATPSVSALESRTQIESADSLVVGSRIEHQRFGIGTVKQLEGDGENRKATVEFMNTGTKQLLLKFAKFKVLS